MSKRELAKLCLARILLGFVLVTIGFAVGRRTAPAPEAQPVAYGDETGQELSDRLVVYAAHMTFRCPECTQIESLARELIEKEYADELADGSLEFQTVDYMRDTDFAKKYNIASSTIVVVPFVNGKEQNFQRLDEVWTKIHKRDDFFEYVRTAIQKALAAEDEE
jgi:hypothetical protein